MELYQMASFFLIKPLCLTSQNHKKTVSWFDFLLGKYFYDKSYYCLNVLVSCYLNNSSFNLFFISLKLLRFILNQIF